MDKEAIAWVVPTGWVRLNFGYIILIHLTRGTRSEIRVTVKEKYEYRPNRSTKRNDRDIRYI
ncbi:hypothetical protein PsorP6_007309 [Peronosclerospora sorghi]|uniref:Uncharacterized protein n=1 Tax=Peronosclerospora sorghi TaxID=230839 RepID=A0ACC0W8R9_9STRA|nr:hypothetical protein PsorP6_007309 [Peronosclerospora sorghi]